MSKPTLLRLDPGTELAHCPGTLSPGSAMSEMALGHDEAAVRFRLPTITSTLGIAAMLGATHLFVDATTVSVILRTAHVHALTPQSAFAIVVAYDILAFGSQVILGVATDRWRCPRTSMRLGLAMTCASVVGVLVHPVMALILTGFGNALFHLGAGATVLDRGLTKAAPVGVYVAPGALGLAFGMAYGNLPDIGPLWPLSVLTALGWIATWTVPPPISDTMGCPSHSEVVSIPKGPMSVALGLLLLSILVRSLVGLSATKDTLPSLWLFYGVPLAAFGGKCLGGFAADQLGWIKTTLVALLASCPLIVFGAQNTALLLTGLFLFQMTMPVTLTATAQLMPKSLATAFGWTCLALILGALPTMFVSMRPISTRPALLGWILVGTLSLLLGLRRVNALRRATSSTTPT